MKIRNRKTDFFLLALSCACVCAWTEGCGVSTGGGIDAGVVGVTTGGTQDVAEARSQIRAGWIPDPESITVEGFLSEHDIPIQPPEDPEEIFASIAVAYRHPFGEPGPMADLFVGMGTTIDLDSFVRPALNLAVVVDRSGSMDGSASADDFRSKMEAVKQALHSLVNQLDQNDRLALMSFNNFWTLDFPAGPIGDGKAVRAAIDRLKSLGSTRIFTPLEAAFQATLDGSSNGRADRVILFTDALPNRGPEGSPQFVDLIERFAKQDVGFTMMGVGLSFGTELAQDISRSRGGNSFFLSDDERISTVFDDDFDFLVTPVAYDLELAVRIPDAIGIRDVYGVPDYEPGTRGARISVPTLFFSRREGGGAIVVRLTSAETPDLEEDVTIGEATLSYTLADGTERSAEFSIVLPAGISPSGDPAYFSEESARRAAVLLDTALVLKEATRAAWDGRYDDAEQMLVEFLNELDQATLGMSDRTDPSSRGLKDERELLESLLGIVR